MTAEMSPTFHDVGNRFDGGKTIFGSLSVTRSTKLGTIPEKLNTRCVRASLLSCESENVHYIL